MYVHEADTRDTSRPLYLPWSGLLSNAWRPYTASMLFHAVTHGLLRMRTLRSPTAMEDGQQLDVPGRPEIIHVPGHTRGDVVVHLPERGVLFSGDALVTRVVCSQATMADPRSQLRCSIPTPNRLRPRSTHSVAWATSGCCPATAGPGDGDAGLVVDLAMAAAEAEPVRGPETTDRSGMTPRR